MKAKAVVFEGPNEVKFREVDCPEPKANQVVVNVSHSWISNGTEGSYLRGERIDGDTPRREGDPYPFPIVAGYQKVGVVDWVGPEIDDLNPGDKVFVIVSDVEGMFEARGGHISPSVSGRGSVFKLPDSAEDPIAYSGLVLTQVGYNCGMRPELSPGDIAVVVGDGLVGQWAGQMLAYRGAQVCMVGRHEDRMAYFKHGSTIQDNKGAWVEEVKKRFPEGIQVGVDTVGSIQVVNQLQECMRRFAHLVSAGFYGTEDTLPLQPPRYKELCIDLVSGATPERICKTMKLVHEGILDTSSLITHHFPVSKAAEAWDLIENKRETVLGVILDWD